MARKKKPRRTPAWMGRLTFVAIVLGVIFTLSYGSGAHIAVRYLNPSFGAWWNSNEFAIVECAAAAVGMLIGIRIGARLVDGALKNRSMIAAVIVRRARAADRRTAQRRSRAFQIHQRRVRHRMADRPFRLRRWIDP